MTTAVQDKIDAHRMSIVGHIDFDGKGDCMHVNVENGVAYVGHMGEYDIGTSIVDVSNPSKPKLITQIMSEPGTHSHKVQVIGDVLLVNHERNRFLKPAPETWSAGLAIFDVSDPANPKKIGFYGTPGVGVHRMSWWQGNHAYVSGTAEGFRGRILQIVDLSDLTNPKQTGRWWFPGQHTAGGEVPDWEPARAPGPGDPGREVALHHALPYGDDRLYCGFWDAGFVILDVSDKTNPKMISHMQLGPESRCTHTVFRPPGSDILVITDEQIQRWIGVQRHVWIVDISDETTPTLLSRLPVPDGSLQDQGIRWGPHNVHEMKPGTLIDPNLIFLTYFAGGIRAYDISDPRNPAEVGHIVPSAPPGRDHIQLNDVTATEDGLIYVTDRHSDGLYIIDFER